MDGISYCILEVDLSARKTQVVKYRDVFLRKYFGGSGLAASILLDRFDPSGDAFHPDNPLIFMTGLFTGIPVPCGCRVSVCAKSPLGHWGEANAGGYWGPELKFTGFDGLVITGRAQEPSYLWVTPKGAEIRSAASLWGKGTFETTTKLLEETDPKARVAAIGPAGETQSFMVEVITGGAEAFRNFPPNLKFVEGLSKFGTAALIESFTKGILRESDGLDLKWGDAQTIVRHEGAERRPLRSPDIVPCCTGDEGRPLGAVRQVKALNHLKLLWSKAMVVSVKEKAEQDFVR